MNSIRIRKIVMVFTVLCVTVFVVSLAFNFLLPTYLSHKLNSDISGASSIGIIGGADGPTSILISGANFSLKYTAIYGILSIAGIIYLTVVNKKREL
jgi:Na+-transporting methylmalonyl-CoA/oxaloacetate decarboxylase beta subunit